MKKRNMPSYNFENKTAREITDVFTSIVNHKGTDADIDEAFEALKSVPPAVQRRVIDDLEDDMIQKGTMTGVAVLLDELEHDGQLDGNDLLAPTVQQELLENIDCLVPMACILSNIARIKKDKAQAGTLFFMEAISSQPPFQGISSRTIAECFAETVEMHEHFDKVGGTAPQATLSSITYLLNNFDLDAAIESLEAADSYTRERLIDRLERDYVGDIKAGAEGARNLTRDDIAFEDPALVEEIVEVLQTFLGFCGYIVKAKKVRGGADPLLGSYVEAGARLTAEEGRDYYHLQKISVTAVDAIAKVEASHTALLSKQAKLKKLAAGQSIRIIGKNKAPGL